MFVTMGAPFSFARTRLRQRRPETNHSALSKSAASSYKRRAISHTCVCGGRCSFCVHILAIARWIVSRCAGTRSGACPRSPRCGGHKRQADRKAENREAPHATFPAKQPFSAEEGTAKLVVRCRVAPELGLARSRTFPALTPSVLGQAHR